MFTAVVIACLGLAQQSEAAGFDTPGWSVTGGDLWLIWVADIHDGFGITESILMWSNLVVTDVMCL